MASWKNTTDILTPAEGFRFIKKGTDLKDEDLEALKDAGCEVDYWKGEGIIEPQRYSEQKGDGVTFNSDGTYVIEGISKKDDDNSIFLPPAIPATPQRKAHSKSDEPVETVVPITEKPKKNGDF